MKNEIIYDVAWQTLRIKIKGSLSRLNNTSHMPLSFLRGYIVVTSDEKEKFFRLWRVLNMLNATRMGFFGSNLQDTIADRVLCKFREGVQREYNELSAKYSINQYKWDTTKITIDLKTLYETDSHNFIKIQNDLQNRAHQTIVRRGSLDTRKELQIFLSLMKSIHLPE